MTAEVLFHHINDSKSNPTVAVVSQDYITHTRGMRYESDEGTELPGLRKSRTSE